MGNWPLALTYARRELRDGLKGFRIFLACVTLGVAAIAAVGQVSSAFVAGLQADGRALLGGDLSLRLSHRPADADQLAFLSARAADISTTIEMRAMARPLDPEARRTLVELKAVEPNYPLASELTLQGGGALHNLLQPQDGVWGAVVDGGLLARLKLDPGTIVRVGEAQFEIRAVIEKEPDRVASVFAFGPRLMISAAALPETQLVQPGSQIRYHHKAVIAGGSSLEAITAELKDTYPDASWRIRTADGAAPGIQRFIDRMTLFLSFVGLTVLLVGGIGVTNAVKSHLEGKTGTIATLKCVGASGTLITQVFLAQILALASIGVVMGLIIGTAVPWFGLETIAANLPVTPRPGLYPVALLQAAVFGLLTALVFALWPLAQARQVKPQALFRALITDGTGSRVRAQDMVTLALSAAFLAALVIGTATDPFFATWFVIGTVATLLVLRISALGVMAMSRKVTRPPSAIWRLALANITRPGSSVPNAVVSLGLGLAVLVAVSLIEANLTRQVSERLPDRAPAFFFLDIQPDQVAQFDEIVTGVEGTTRFQRTPSLRGRVIEIDGVPVDEVDIDPDSRWVVRGDRGLTYRTEPLSSDKIVDGAWWPEDYAGPPLISLEAKIARGFGIGIGDTLTVDILGRPITATIGNLRDIEWGSLQFDFVIIFAPGTLEGAPQTHVAAVAAPEDLEDTIERQVADAFGNVSAIRVREALAAAARVLEGVSWAVTATALVTILSGALVLAGTIAAGHRRRVFDAVILKVLGATRTRIGKAFLIEYGLVGFVTAVIGGVVGMVTAWAVVTHVMRADWALDGVVAGQTILACLALSLLVGFLGTYRALGEKAAPHLRNE